MSARGGLRRSFATLAAALALAGGSSLVWAQPHGGAEPPPRPGGPGAPGVRPGGPGGPGGPGMPGGRPGGPGGPGGPGRPGQMPQRPGMPMMPRPGASGARPPVPMVRPGHDEHGSEHGAKEGGEHHGVQPLNWAYGLLGERDGVQPNLLYRSPGMPVPLLANVINFGLLVLLGVSAGRKPLGEGLAKRRETLMREMDEAARLKREAESRLQSYKKRLDKVGDEIERIKSDYAAQAKRDHERIVREAEEKGERMRRDADFLLQQERKAAVGRLTEHTADEAVRRAEAMLRAGVSDADQQRLADEYLRDVAGLSGAVGGAA